MPMFEDPHDAVLAVSLDLTTGFAGTFAGPEEVTPVGRFRDQAVGTLSDLPSDLLSVVAWEWPVEHVGPLQGISATHRNLTLRGVTVIERAINVTGREETVLTEGEGEGEIETELVFSRYIDWLALYAELGAITIARPQVDDRTNLPENVPHDVDPVQ